ncbi:AAA family ATPase [Changpingibacter yushuensis]|uniref:AAA family ATPase n=1 Tax=Changpingibacter yushuensis TaxID=2758440 RepID=UPI0015F5DD44|nr:AAA family ATPase [Changpingibacter yushuensis]
MNVTDPILAPGSPARAALAHVWAGDEVVILSSPPGAGKTEVITSIAPHLAQYADLTVTIATPTVAGAYDLAYRLKNKLSAFPDISVALVGSAFNARRSRGVRLEKTHLGMSAVIEVRTVASMKMSAVATDVLIVDEAYQCTALDVREAAGRASQILLVGDPGQIGPVITIDTIAWDGLKDSPALRSPDMFSTWPGAILLHLDSSFRLGTDTVRAIKPLYDFDFVSSRPPASIEGEKEISILDLGRIAQPADVSAMRRVVSRAASLVGRTYRYGDKEKALTPADVVLMASRNEQVALLESLVAADKGLKGMIVGTADSLQGGQWPVGVAVDPLAGAATASDHAMTPGRLCVMCSRHIAHLTFATSADVTELLADSTTIQRTVRENLTEASA